MNFLTYSRQSIDDSDIKAVCDALRADIITGGQKVSDFEKALCDYTGAKYAVAMNSATSALHCAYLALGLKNGDEIITTPITFAATANAAIMCGADVKWAGVDENSGNIDIKSIEPLITPKTKILAPIDLGGNPLQMEKIIELAKKHDLKVVDDASHALGSGYKNGIKIGSGLCENGTKGADITILSFHAIKPITTLEGGALLTNHENIAQKARLLRSHGISKKELWDSDMSALGYNYRISDVACALGLSQLKRLDSFVALRNEIAKIYDEFFERCQWAKNVKIPANITSSRHLYMILLNDELAECKKEIFSALHDENIGVQVHYKPTYLFSFYKGKNVSIESAENFYKKELSLPCHQLMSENDAKRVLAVLENIIKSL